MTDDHNKKTFELTPECVEGLAALNSDAPSWEDSLCSSCSRSFTTALGLTCCGARMLLLWSRFDLRTQCDDYVRDEITDTKDHGPR